MCIFFLWNPALWLPCNTATLILKPLCSGQNKSPVFNLKNPFNAAILIIQPNCCGLLVARSIGFHYINISSRRVVMSRQYHSLIDNLHFLFKFLSCIYVALFQNISPLILHRDVWVEISPIPTSLLFPPSGDKHVLSSLVKVCVFFFIEKQNWRVKVHSTAMRF